MWLVRLLRARETPLAGTPKGIFEEAQQKHTFRNSDP